MRPGCKFCDKHGLPILLTRYAISPENAKTQALPSNLKPKLKTISGDAGGAAPDMGQTCGYTLRMVRPGYLYQFDEKTSQWTAYSVLEGGYLYQLSLDPHHPDPSDPKQQDDPSKEVFACSSIAADASMAIIVTVPNADKATKVWFAYAEALWTKDVFAKHQEQAWRKKNMRVFDVAAWRGNHQHVTNATPISDVDKVVAEFQLEEAQAGTGFGWAASGFHRKDKPATTNLIANCTALLPHKKYPPAIVALDDPTGMMQELSQLMEARTYAFKSNPLRRRKLAVSGSIDQIKRVSQELAEDGALNDAATSQAILAAGSEGTVLMSDEGIKTYNDAGKVSKEDLEAAVAKAWKKKYASRFDESAKNSFDQQYKSELEAFDNAHISPLAKALSTILGDPLTQLYFKCNHDQKSIQSGFAYVLTYVHCIANTQDKPACAKELQKQLQGVPGEDNAEASTALAINNEKLIEKIKDAVKPSVDPWHIPWSALTDAFKAAISMAEEGGTKAAVKLAEMLVLHLGTPIMYVLDKTVEGSVKCFLPALLGMIADAPVVKVEVTGKMGDLCAHMARQLQLIGGKDLSKRSLEVAVQKEVRKLGIRGVPIDGTKKKSFAILVDEEFLKGLKLDPKMSKDKRKDAVLKAFRTPEQMEEMNLRYTFERFKGAGAEVSVTGVSIILQIFIISTLYNDIKKSLEDDKTEACWRFGAGIISLIGFIGEATESFAEGLLKLGVKRAITFERLATIGRWTGRIFGTLGGAILAYWDFNAALEAKHDGNYGMAALYLVSSVSGLAVAVLFAWCAVVPIVGWICLAILLVVTVLIEIFKDSNIQKWLDRCVWGRKEIYPKEEEEMHEFQLALEA